MIRNIDFINKRQNIAIGIALPFNNAVQGVFELSYETKTQMISNFKNLILTNKRERIMLPEFGTNITKLLFEQNTEFLNDTVKSDILEATSRYCPYINIQKLDIRQFVDVYAFVIDIYYNLVGSDYVNQLTLSVNEFGDIQLL